jgi:hypothetical protein
MVEDGNSCSRAVILLEEHVHLRICGSQGNFQHLHDSLDLQDRPFCQCVIAVELISDDLKGFVDWYIGEKTDDIKANEGIWILKIYRLQ